MQIYSKFLARNPYFNDGRWITGANLKGFMLHSVATPQPDPMVFINGWNKESYTRAGINGFIGADAVYLTASSIDTPSSVKRMPHAGMPAGNNGYIGFEMCEPKQIVYNSNGTKIVSCSDPVAAAAFVKAVYENAVELFAKLCEFHRKDPLAPGVIISHKEGNALGVASNHGDPDQLWSYFRLGYTMDKFRQDVARKMTPEKPEKEEETEVRYNTIRDMKNEAQAVKYYLPTIQRLIDKGVLAGKGGKGDDLIVDLSEDSVRLLVILERTGVFG